MPVCTPGHNAGTIPASRTTPHTGYSHPCPGISPAIKRAAGAIPYSNRHHRGTTTRCTWLVRRKESSDTAPSMGTMKHGGCSRTAARPPSTLKLAMALTNGFGRYTIIMPKGLKNGVLGLILRSNVDNQRGYTVKSFGLYAIIKAKGLKITGEFGLRNDAIEQ